MDSYMAFWGIIQLWNKTASLGLICILTCSAYLMILFVCLFVFLITELVEVGYENTPMSSVGQSMGSMSMFQW